MTGVQPEVCTKCNGTEQCRSVYPQAKGTVCAPSIKSIVEVKGILLTAFGSFHYLLIRDLGVRFGKLKGSENGTSFVLPRLFISHSPFLDLALFGSTLDYNRSRPSLVIGLVYPLPSLAPIPLLYLAL